MQSITSSRLPRRKWRTLSLLFLSLLPALAIFHVVMWFTFTRTLFRPETGSAKRIGYLVTLEDCMGKLQAREPRIGFSMPDLGDAGQTSSTRVVIFGDSFAGSIAKAGSLAWHEPVGSVGVNWGDQGLSHVEAQIKSGWFQARGAKVIIVERFECEWLDTFAEPIDNSLPATFQQVGPGTAAPIHEKAAPWTVANNGNFKVIIDNIAYLFSPTAFNMTDTVIVHLNRNFFGCSYGNLLLFYRGEITRGICDAKRAAKVKAAFANLKELSDLCHRAGLKFYLIVPPNKSSLYYEWVDHPFYAKSPTLDVLRDQATNEGYVDLSQRFHHELDIGTQDFYYPDDHHWNFPGAVDAVDELTKAGAGPTP